MDKKDEMMIVNHESLAKKIYIIRGQTGQTHEKIKIAYSNNSVYDTVKEKQRSPV